jgi:hypothetical protein
MSRHLSLREFGAGLLVTPNAMHALEFLGAGEVIAATSNVSNEQLIRHFQSGNIIHRRPAGHYYNQNTVPAISRFTARTFITLRMRLCSPTIPIVFISLMPSAALCKAKAASRRTL